MFSSSVHKVDADYCRNVPDTELYLTILKCGYLIPRCILTIPDVYLRKRFIRDPFKYGRSVQSVFKKDKSAYFGDNRNSSVLISGIEEKIGGLCIAKGPLLFAIRIAGIIRSQKYEFLSMRR